MKKSEGKTRKSTSKARDAEGNLLTAARTEERPAHPIDPEGETVLTDQEQTEPLSAASEEPSGGAQRPEESPIPETGPPEGFPIVGIGASAGGLSAFETFFNAMPLTTESAMAFVLVQHLSPDHKSILSDLLRRYTRMEVFEVEDGMAVQPNCVYIMPPNRDMAFLNGNLHLLERTATRGHSLPIDFFLRSLAQDQHERAIGIILSGTGSDGMLGVRAIKGEGGMVMVQDPDSTTYDGMPRSAISTGLVDFILTPAGMPPQLIAYVNHTFGKKTRPVSPPSAQTGDILKKICLVVRTQTGHDFSQYKEKTIQRRMERRMALHQIDQPDQYLKYLHANPEEVEVLFRDFLIGVTNFFRDPEAFAVLEKQIIPRLFDAKPLDGTVRVWVCGCSTGEEAYSIAILIQEHLEMLRQPFKVLIFATDIDRLAIEQARSGLFPESIAVDIPPAKLPRFFVHDPVGKTYRVQKVIRDMVIFSEQDVIKDPPFSRLDLVSCRNLLIYMNSKLQKKLLPLFHYALNPRGVLFLGSSESIGDFANLFEVQDRKWKFYMRKEDLSESLRPTLSEIVPPVGTPLHKTLPDHEQGLKTDFKGLMEQALLGHYAQAAALITGFGEILHIYGRTGKFLEPSPGDARMNILTMAREGLRREMVMALQKVVTQKEPVRFNGLRIKTNGDFITVNLFMRPVKTGVGPALSSDFFLVILEEAQGEKALPEVSPFRGDDSSEKGLSILRLEQDLRAKEEYLQTTLEEMETSNEELKSTNEELQSVNEELQSTNEELETSKEELQSLNEELATVNAELQNKVSDLSQVNNDMNNLLAGTGVGTLFVDFNLRIERFTPAVTQVINLIQGDIGRPVGHIVSNLEGYDHLVEDLKKVLDDLAPREREVRTKAGEWYLMRLRPYRTLENVIKGAVISFINISDRKKIEDALQETETFAQGIIDTLRESLVVLDERLMVVSANRAFYRTFQTEPEKTVGHPFYELDGRQWDIPVLRAMLGEILAKDIPFEDYEVSLDFERIGRLKMLLNARRINRRAGKPGLILLALENKTGPNREEPIGDGLSQ